MKEINVETFRGIMNRQLHLAKKCARIIDDLKSAIDKKAYEYLGELVSSFSASSIKLNLVEKEREVEFNLLKSKLGLNDDDGFYEFIEKIEDDKNSLSTIYTDLRMVVSKMQASVWVIDSYLKAVTSMLHSVMDNICPNGSGNTYSNIASGEREIARGPMVLNFSA